MTSRYIPAKVRRRVKAAARNRCGYCLCAQQYVYIKLTIEHLIPTALGGSDDESNLWLSCGRCNGGKGIQVDGYDFVTGQWVPLFNPRTQVWKEHFRWDATGIQIIGLTAIGRATVDALKLIAVFKCVRPVWCACALAGTSWRVSPVARKGIVATPLPARAQAHPSENRYNIPEVLVVRRNWVSVGWHPPEDSL